VLMLRLRCYLPSTSAIIVTLTVAYVILHAAAGRGFAGFSLATEIIIGLGLAGLAASTIVISAVTIQRRRAAAGACHACSHLCRGAMVPLPERGTRRWPHRSLTPDPAEQPAARQPLPLTVVPPQRTALTPPATLVSPSVRSFAVAPKRVTTTCPVAAAQPERTFARATSQP
jgi:hypothetical protein